MRRQVDSNQSEIVAALRQIGVTVTVLSMVGFGCPDIVAGYRGINYLLEIKDGMKSPSRQKLTPAEMRWHRDWEGQSAIVVSVEDAIRTVTDEDS